MPAAVGVPEIVPALPNVRPVGREPDARDHEYGLTPAVAESAVKYVIP
jgi:hypothetical protein